MSQIINGNNSDVLDTLPSESVDLEVDSPAYYHQRIYSQGDEQIYGGNKLCDHEFEVVPVTWRKPSPGDKPTNRSIYGKSGRTNDELRPAKESKSCYKCGAWLGDLGLEPTPQLYINHLCGIYDKVKRVLKKTGVLLVNLGEKYNDSGGAGHQYDKRKIEKDAGFSLPCHIENVSKSSALCIPWLFACSMVYEHNWILKDTLIWQKKVPTPYSGEKKFTLDYEPIFFFGKTPDYYFKQPKVRKKITRCLGHEFGGKKAGDGGYCNNIYSQRRYDASKSSYKTRRTNLEEFDNVVIVDGEYFHFLENSVYDNDDYDKVFKLNTSKTREKHHATWPIELVTMLIEMGCPPGGTVMDCFGGVGNTAIGAAKLNRDYILIELSKKYYNIAKRRVYNATADRDFVRNAINLNELR